VSKLLLRLTCLRKLVLICHIDRAVVQLIVTLLTTHPSLLCLTVKQSELQNPKAFSLSVGSSLHTGLRKDIAEALDNNENLLFCDIFSLNTSSALNVLEKNFKKYLCKTVLLPLPVIESIVEFYGIIC